MEDPGDGLKRRSITSEGLSSRAVLACWAVATGLLGAGVSATFLVGTGAAPAAMILFGSLFVVLALMKRVPLSLEVGGTKFDASYERAEAFDAGREIGLQQGVEVALGDVEKAEESGEPPHLALERRRDAWQSVSSWQAHLDLALDVTPPPDSTFGYRGPTACNAAGITYRQLDYWARTGLIEPSARVGNSRLYTERDIVLLRVIKQLLNAGVSLQQIRTMIGHLRGRTGDLERVTLISDGRSIYEATTADEVLDLLQSGRGVFGIAIGGVLREVREILSELPGERARPDAPPEPS